MKLSRSHFLKWLSAEDPQLEGLDQYFEDTAVLLFSNHNSSKVEAMTLFNDSLFDELQKRLMVRIASIDLSQYTLRFVAPTSMKNKIETLRLIIKTPSEVLWADYFNISNRNKEFHIQETIRIINVDDSPVLLKFLKHTLEEISNFKVIKQVEDPLQAVHTILEFKPDLVTMDIQMPIKNGVRIVQELLEKIDIPVIMISSLSPEEGPLVLDALEAGAFDYIQKPRLDEKVEFKITLKQTILAALCGRSHLAFKRKYSKKSVAPSRADFNASDDVLWCLGASTGGTQALTRVLTALPNNIPPTLIVQHIPAVFSKSFADSLNDLCPFEVKEASDGDKIQKNKVYIAPGGIQMKVEQREGQLFIRLKDDPPVNRFKPSVDYMFKSVADISNYNIVAGVLTGMGHDGAQGLLALRKKGAFTFTQDEESCAVYGMPRAAYELGASQKIAPLDEMAQIIMDASIKHRKVG